MTTTMSSGASRSRGGLFGSNIPLFVILAVVFCSAPGAGARAPILSHFLSCVYLTGEKEKERKKITLWKMFFVQRFIFVVRYVQEA